MHLPYFAASLQDNTCSSARPEDWSLFKLRKICSNKNQKSKLLPIKRRNLSKFKKYTSLFYKSTSRNYVFIKYTHMIHQYMLHNLKKHHQVLMHFTKCKKKKYFDTWVMSPGGNVPESQLWRVVNSVAHICAVFHSTHLCEQIHFT